MGIRIGQLRKVRVAAALIMGLAMSVGPMATIPAYAQFSESYKFLKAVKDQDGQKVTDMLSSSASTLINTRDVTTGDSALHLVIQRRDASWLSFLLSKGAKPDIRDKAGNTPILAAAQLGFVDAVPMLVNYKADVNSTNGRGETALIIAVQRRDIALVRQLISLGANPALRDTVIGLSARDYAERDKRSGAILKILDEAKPAVAKPVSGPKF
ncbi:ankyrin repeat domain-containing protein [Aquisediminimonas sediminicola]|uniref:ankyrin repeat domain-containing protein n=1 Tax=Alteraquisediminimonas sediminicola TaxID=2676787 RepID=UPI001FEBFB72|nr:ankyrin repeat domain-containing protein [Aquisediminimonas sediminicola]